MSTKTKRSVAPEAIDNVRSYIERSFPILDSSKHSPL